MKKAMTALAALCLVLVISSGAYAAKGLLTGADVKAHTLSATLFSASARNALAGNAGARGLTGQTGLTGLTGFVGLTGNKGENGAA